MNAKRKQASAHLINALPYFALAILTASVYYKAIGFEFLYSWDDGAYILRNEHIRGFSLNNIKAVFSKNIFVSYDPLHMLSLMIDYSIWGGYSAKGYHLGNIVLHGLNACVLYALIRRVTGSGVVGLIASALFVVHPVNVENVAWCAERKTLLSGLFFFLSFGQYVRFAETGRKGNYVLSLVLYTASMFTKATTITLPVLLLLYDFIYRGEGIRLRRLMPFFLLAAGCFVLFVGLFSREGIVGGNSVDLGTLLGVVYPSLTTITWHYMRLIFWPTELSGLYGATLYTWLTLPVAAAVGGWAVLFALVWRSGSAQVKFWFLWFWVCLLPVSGIIPQNTFYYADRYMYTPAIGMMVIFSIGVVYMADFLGASSVRRRFVYALASLVIVILAYTANVRTEVWRNDIVFWQDVVAKSPEMIKPHMQLGAVYANRDMFREAEAEYLRALAIDPDSSSAQLKLKILYGNIYETMEYMKNLERQYSKDLKKGAAR